jgi:hypothetical protein
MKIYKIIYEEKIIYIGKTKLDLHRRHLAGHPYYPEYRLGQIELIEETDDIRRERFWIDYYRNTGEPLLNRQNGDGFNVKTDSKFDYKGYLKVYRKKWASENKNYWKEYRLRKKQQKINTNEI